MARGACIDNSITQCQRIIATEHGTNLAVNGSVAKEIIEEHCESMNVALKFSSIKWVAKLNQTQ